MAMPASNHTVSHATESLAMDVDDRNALCEYENASPSCFDPLSEVVGLIMYEPDGSNSERTLWYENDERAPDERPSRYLNTRTFVGPNLSQYIPEDIDEELLYQLSLFDPAGRQWRKHCDLARATVEWYYFCCASQHLIAQGQWRRPFLEKSDRSMTWLGETVQEDLPTPLVHFQAPELTTRKEKPPMPVPIHHFNFWAQPVTFESNTPPEVSKWHAFSPALKSKTFDNVPLRQRVIAAQAGKLLEPFNHERECINSFTPHVNLPVEGYYMSSMDGDIVINDDGRSRPTYPRRETTVPSPLHRVENCEVEPYEISPAHGDLSEENACEGNFIIKRAQELSRSRARHQAIWAGDLKLTRSLTVELFKGKY